MVVPKSCTSVVVGFRISLKMPPTMILFTRQGIRSISSYSSLSKKCDLNLRVNFKYKTPKNTAKGGSTYVNHKDSDIIARCAKSQTFTSDLEYPKVDENRHFSHETSKSLERSRESKFGGFFHDYKDEDKGSSRDLIRTDHSWNGFAEHSSRNKHRNVRNDGGSIVIGEIVFGINPVTIALDVQRRPFHQLFIKRSSICNQNKRLTAVENQAIEMGIRVHRVKTNFLDQLSGNRPHQGVCLDAGSLDFELYVPEESNTEKTDCDDTKKLWIFLDRIHDPMNFGAVLRSCYFFGVNKVFTVKKDSCPLTPVVSKASSGVMEALVVYQISHPLEFLKSRKRSWSIVGSASHDAIQEVRKVVQLNDFIWPKQTILMIGNEGSGISKELVDLCDTVITIPQKQGVHPNVQSLNVSVATGILLHSFFSHNTK